eukprot:scaffold123169_cov35-Tisochrysis_lutea.AAC.1
MPAPCARDSPGVASRYRRPWWSHLKVTPHHSARQHGTPAPRASARHRARSRTAAVSARTTAAPCGAAPHPNI